MVVDDMPEVEERAREGGRSRETESTTMQADGQDHSLY